MTMKNTKTILFASLIVAMILPFSGMTNTFADTNKVDSNLLLEKFVKLANKANQIQSQIHILEHTNERVNKINVLDLQLSRIQEQMDKLQQQNILAVNISPSELASL